MSPVCQSQSDAFCEELSTSILTGFEKLHSGLQHLVKGVDSLEIMELLHQRDIQEMFQRQLESVSAGNNRDKRMSIIEHVI